MNPLSVTPNPAVAFTLRYQDADLVVAEKPSGVVTQPGKGHTRDSLLNGLFAQFGSALQNMGAARDWGLLHRLDRDTSGLVIVGLSQLAYDALREAFAARRIKKTYLAIVSGRPPHAQGSVHKPIAEVLAGGLKKAQLSREGQPATTAYRVLATTVAAPGGPGASLVECRPATGRLHQIRVHMADLGCPLLGEDIYRASGPPARVAPPPRLCLHAAEINFVHPRTQRRMTVRSPLPDDLAKYLKRLRLTPPPEPAADSRAPADEAD